MPKPGLAGLLNGSPEELLHNFYCRGHVNSFTPPKDIVHGLVRPLFRAVTGHLLALGQNMRNRFFPFPAKMTRTRSRPTVSRSVQSEECVFRFYMKDLYRATPMQTLKVSIRLVRLKTLGNSLIFR
ncbi:hypothetical protein PoB_002386000 [Plakobranchus ocellatus]|uniref:Uncharacterized protein n=1 Tax=Plakobranchus ocellatus TaxID=259542 RepID=A0AAV3ZNS7_9GAST|nr:hypothetical protein PoB_002386000 [Plakobranchus ocellatus]